MKINKENLLQILSIGHDTSIRGEGLFLRQSMSRTYYRKMRKQFSQEDLIPLIQENEEYITQWIMYSLDKRTSSGWYINEDGDVYKSNSYLEHYDSIEEAVAVYVIRELDYWANA